MADVEDEVEDESESNQAETTGKRKRLFHKECSHGEHRDYSHREHLARKSVRERCLLMGVRCMMFGFGDDQVPFTESVDLLEDLVVEYITEMTLKAMEVGKKGKVHVEDIVFLIRKDPKKYARVKDLLTMNEELKKARKAFDAESYGEMV